MAVNFLFSCGLDQRLNVWKFVESSSALLEPVSSAVIELPDIAAIDLAPTHTSASSRCVIVAGLGLQILEQKIEGHS